MKPLFRAIQVWLLALVICAAVIAWSFSNADLPLAQYCARYVHFLSPLGRGLGSAVILSAETVTVMALALTRLARGQLPPLAGALAIACLTSICAYGINSNVLKIFFGVPNPSAVLSGSLHAFNLWTGSAQSSFPSGHMVLAAAFAGVFMRLYRASRWPVSIFLLLVAALLIAGDWHFLSDVIAGTFAGLSAGLLAGELWEAHAI